MKVTVEELIDTPVRVLAHALIKLSDRYKRDVVTLGRAVLELEFSTKMTDEIREQLRVAKEPNDIVKVRETITAK